MAFLPADCNPWKDAEVRRALSPLAKLAQDLNVAIVLIRHWNKKEDSKAMYRGGGSIAFTGLARSVLAASIHPDGKDRVLAVVKCNLDKPASSLRYGITDSKNGDICIEWKGETMETADDLASTQPRTVSLGRKQRAIEWLKEKLAQGPVKSSDLWEWAKAEGISQKTYERARTQLGVVPKQTSDGWLSELTPDRQNVTPSGKQWDGASGDPLDLPEVQIGAKRRA
jgi:hypothetical protein